MAIADNPLLSATEQVSGTKYKRKKSGSHLIYAVVSADLLLVERVLHESMDAERHLA